jgi:multiple antibiotic resistance protein
MQPLAEYSRFAISLLAVLSPVAAVPVFLSHTKGRSSKEASRAAFIAASTAALVLVTTALIGQSLLPMLGTSLGSLQTAGGLVMLLAALSRLNPGDAARTSSTEQGSSAAIVPLGFPLLAGAGSISSVIVVIRKGSGAGHAAVVIACVLAACTMVWAVLRAAHPIGIRLGRRGLNAAIRIFAFLGAAIAVQFITAGLRSSFPVLG